MIRYKKILEKSLVTIEKDALSDTSFTRNYATGRLQGMLEAALHSGDEQLYYAINEVHERVSSIQEKEPV